MPPFSIGARECLKGVLIAIMMRRVRKLWWTQFDVAPYPSL